MEIIAVLCAIGYVLLNGWEIHSLRMKILQLQDRMQDHTFKVIEVIKEINEVTKTNSEAILHIFTFMKNKQESEHQDPSYPEYEGFDKDEYNQKYWNSDWEDDDIDPSHEKGFGYID